MTELEELQRAITPQDLDLQGVDFGFVVHNGTLREYLRCKVVLMKVLGKKEFFAQHSNQTLSIVKIVGDVNDRKRNSE